MPAPATDPDAAGVELRRVVERWRQLPLGHAAVGMPVVQAVVQRLADAVADAEGRLRAPVPDLGPAVVMDQLTVVVYDASAAGIDVSRELAALRGDL